MEELRNSIQRSIEDLHKRGANAHLLVDATRDGVEVPDHVREQWGQRLVLDLNPSWPLHLDYDDQALYADLGFQGVLSRCRIPFRAVWAVMDTASGNGFVFHANVPAEVARELAARGPDAAAAPPSENRDVAPSPVPRPARGAAAAKPPKAKRKAPSLRLVKGGKS
jgi:stringent starvation protein B